MANIDKINVNGTTYNIIDTTSGYITSANDIYWCTYGTTTSAEIETAINAGKCPMVKYTNYTYTLRYRNSSTNHRFVCNYGGKEYSVVCQSSTWMPDGTLTFLTSAPVTSVNTKTGAVSLTASDVGALPSSTSIPTKTSDLTNDSGFITSSDISAGTGISFTSNTISNTAPIWHGDEVGDLPVPINADQLEGHSASYFQTAEEIENVGGATIYRCGKLRCIYVRTASADIATLSSRDLPVGDCRTMSKVYNGTTYVDCYVAVYPSGKLVVRDLYGGEVADAQYGFLVTRVLTYFVQ